MASIPWQPRPEGCNEIIWRNTANPIIGRYDIPCSNSIFNSAVVPFKDGYAGVFRADNRRVQMNIFAGFSDDGVHWRINHEPIRFQSFDGAPTESDYKYDPRVACIDGKYYITWCNGYHGPTIGLGFTEDFQTFYQCENALLPFCRNGVLFPEKINGQYALLSRPSDNGHTPFGDIFVSFSPDLKYWGHHRHVISPTPFEQSAWQCTKVGAGTVPILTEKGWLMFYHGVITTCNGYRYAMGAVLLDKDEPWKVIRRSYDYLLGPAAPYELTGDVQNVVFPCAALTEGDKVSIYYGAADTCVCLAHGHISEILDWLDRQHA